MKKIYLTLATALFFISTYSQNTCSTAITLGETGQFTPVSGDTTSSGDNVGNDSNDVFYIITPGAAQTINIWLCFTGEGYDFKLTVYSGTCGLLTAIATNDDSCGLSPQLSFQSEVGQSYYVVVEGSDNPEGGNSDNGPFNISTWYEAALTPPTAPTGITCTPATSGPTDYFMDEMDEMGGWTGNIFAGDQLDLWEIGTAKGLHSPDTGPSSAFSSSSYMSFSSDGGNVSVSAISPAIDLTNMALVEDAELTFYMHAYGIDMGTLNVYVGTSSTAPVGGVSEFTWSGQWQSIDSQDWVQVGIDISSLVDDVIYVEFKYEIAGVEGEFHVDMAIDLLEVSVCDTALEVEEEEILDKVSLDPNPAKDIINIQSQEIIDEIKIYNLLGQEVMSTQPRQLQTQIDIASLSIGVYVVKVQVGNQIGSYKIVKQ